MVSSSIGDSLGGGGGGSNSGNNQYREYVLCSSCTCTFRGHVTLFEAQIENFIESERLLLA